MINTKISESKFKPKVLIYFCNFCCGSKSAHNGLSLAHISDSITSVHFKCAREVTPEQIRRGFAGGADGILLCGCLVRDCEKKYGDLEVLRSLYRNQMTLKKLGLISDRLREDWVVQGTTDRLECLVEDFIAHLTELGPMRPPEIRPVVAPREIMKESQA